MTATYTDNAMGRVTRLLNQIGGTTISDFSSIAYDGVGNRTSVTASIPGATSLNGTTGYTYDSKNQLTQETSTRNGGFTDNFAYDSAGNPTTFKSQTKTYNSSNQQTATGLSYDGNGNPTTYGGSTLTFDPENRMTAYGSVLTAGYSGNGLRAWKQTSSGRTYFLYDGVVPVVELDTTGAVVSTNTFGATGLISRRTGSTSVFYVFDSEGNVSVRTDSSGNSLSSYLFNAFGESLSGSQTDPFGYRGQFGYYTDNETGLQLLTHRYYNSSTGRFVTADPQGYEGGINLYSYVRNSPLRNVDPIGTAPQDPKQLTKPEPFVVTNIDLLESETIAGNIQYLDDNGVAQCARLPLAWEIDQEGWLESRLNRGRRLTPNWGMGPEVHYGMGLKKGTVLATFDRQTGKYSQLNSGQGGENHTVVFLRWTTQNGQQGMTVVQQMSGRNGRAQIGFIPFETGAPYYRNAYRFNVVMVSPGYSGPLFGSGP